MGACGIIRDPLVLTAGLMREPFWRVVLVVTLAKAGRYIVLSWATLQLA
jgi:membrane protein YqaA with SNARE-associated domain